MTNDCSSDLTLSTGHFNGQLCEWWWILSLLVFGGSWMRSNCTSRCVCTRLSTDRWSSDVRPIDATEENQTREYCANVASQVKKERQQQLHSSQKMYSETVAIQDFFSFRIKIANHLRMNFISFWIFNANDARRWRLKSNDLKWNEFTLKNRLSV